MTRSITLLLAASLGIMTLPLLTGCEHEIKHTDTTVTKSDGTTAHEDTTVKQMPNGDVVTQHDKTNNNP